MLIKEAFAQAANSTAQTSDPTLMSFLPMIGIVVIFYFLLIRPQTKRAKEQKQMQNELQKGDEIIISGGELGRVVSTGDSYLTMEIAVGVEITVLKSSVQTLLPKGTLRSIETGKSSRALKSGKQKSNEPRQAEPENKETEISEADSTKQDNEKN
ncbi:MULTISPECIES: preprotein translocase subunit YajC [Nitrosomonas]|uniref:Sec translocon accessory complex subunit YajC n=2 Tax=Nitrosomonas eutropha TaxID=916 RepID=A0ABX5M8D3_9PROT|nr:MULTISPECIES: preprotein translocase subunit YajC [Nitrosomonas]ABI59678.1 protein translocase subunit yajC [Nitrosomonas eutropha C91]MXS80226.1 preprotein translocase subunit YajC [Nitrosomonas sp. GH22]PXV82523.1 protein translocase subunit yajC [Nitrosomonas eutropha]SCX00922.1 protein translocase subunit yajC [Nitrosomonas eutropha]SDW34076.1 protein translocase subunit yajC [Nitrosomonas eutropha]